MSDRLHRLVDAALSAPGIGTIRRRRFDSAFERGDFPGAYRGIFASYQDAARAVPATMPTGYDSEVPASLYRDRLNRLFASDYPMMLWLTRIFATGVTTVLDLGGHVGLSYYAYQTLVPYPRGLRWEVSDVPAVVRAGRELAVERDTLGALSFSDSFGTAREAELLFTAGCVQYLEQTLAERVGGMSTKPAWVLVNLLPLHESLEYFTVQSISGAFCPYRIEKRAKFFDAMNAAGYDVHDTWENPEKGCAVKFQPQFDVRGYTGAVFRRRSP